MTQSDTAARLSRRSLLKSGGALAGLSFSDVFSRSQVEAAPKSNRAFEIAKIDRVTVKNPFREVPERNMSREIPHWKYSEICSVTLKSGHVGHGETLLYYTWGATEDEDVAHAQGKNAAEIMWDDELGAGLQMAIFDAIGKAMDVPVYALLGQRVHDRTPLAWWNIDTSPEDMALECAEAYRQGYRAYKTKGRPWFDPWAMAEATSKVVPKDFKVAYDFNDTLLTAERGIPILKDLAEYSQTAIWETPIFQRDIRGNIAIRNATDVPVAMHYGHPDPYIVLTEDACDGFVVGGGATRVLREAGGAALGDKPFWLQLVGMGLTATWSKHFGAVLSHATWPAVNCHQLFQNQLLVESITVKDGYSSIPEGPGLGCEIDWDTVHKLKVPKPKSRPEPQRLIETTWPDGRRMYLSNNGRVNFMLNLAQHAGMPYFEKGVFTKLLPNDGSAKWTDLYNEARKGPVFK